ncbi:YtxH domain-containing protein [Enterococcus columbae]|uniref:General stress protein n=1 Tax=Enterococcus columbae DSM 7374 = ATCC 51263 TaxID=1121865 RepID=S0KVI0_9ENTE|nr:YtxH domain-containing protein [Enterococcus columbae]EOT44143.1 hypothetical protein OMW_00197 [Enterococcus columbae DSM 7374 = ATCC 51263]EOW84301.1 hypothetical protein I568_00795 [Enterococcus columbae DSM 7374 = ATCC 51263]OJG26141.1 hypothetical protein RR47_GL000939 [Enterococcus columbae DSM 7374 = ATCC 51263]
MSNKGGFLLGALIGGTAAAVTALLLAPESGKDLRNRLAKQVDDLLDTTSDYGDQAANKADALKKYAQEKAVQFAKQSEELSALLKEKTGYTTNEIYQDLKEQVTDLTKKVKDSVKEIDEEVIEPVAEDIVLDFEALAQEEQEQAQTEEDVLIEDIHAIIDQVAAETKETPDTTMADAMEKAVEAVDDVKQATESKAVAELEKDK